MPPARRLTQTARMKANPAAVARRQGSLISTSRNQHAAPCETFHKGPLECVRLPIKQVLRIPELRKNVCHNLATFRTSQAVPATLEVIIQRIVLEAH